MSSGALAASGACGLQGEHWQKQSAGTERVHHRAVRSHASQEATWVRVLLACLATARSSLLARTLSNPSLALPPSASSLRSLHSTRPANSSPAPARASLHRIAFEVG
ncbi:hypothetical protein HaLaN_18282 [Haematococcus lacustris]|uniref:Uncharacterized protein n=1 Tax=Haematococcus lacustris TaxID=44745 RepID=A0A699ZYF4_HAELA|nr:hypothetical protein HaLaN_18282 [Haematococcus lacustris]